MRLFDLFENAEPSDDELFGGDDAWGAIPSIIKMLRGYHTSTMAELDSYDGDVRDELEDEAEQADWTADVLARGETKKGIELLLSLDHQTRGTMTEFLKSYNVDMKRVYTSVLGTTPHWLTEDEPSDDELFGASKYNIGDIVGLLNAIATHYNRNYDTEELLDDADIMADAAENFQRRGMRAGCDRLMDVNSPSVMTYLTSMFNNKLGININKMFNEFGTDMHESTEPNDDELFGNDIDPQLKIIKLIDQQIQFNKSQLRIISINSRIKSEQDSALIEQRQKNIKRLEQYKQAFSNSLRDGFALWSKDLAETDVFKNPYRSLAIMLRADAREDNINLSALSESTEPSDDDLFGDDDIQIQSKAIKVLNKLIKNVDHVVRSELLDVGVQSVDALDLNDSAQENAYDEIQNALNIRKYYELFRQEFIKSFADGISAWHHEFTSSFTHDYGSSAAAMVDYDFSETYNMRLEDYATHLKENAQPSDDDLFGDDIQIQSRAIAILDRMIEGSKANIQQVLADIGKNSIDDVDPEEDDNAFYEIHNDLEAIRHFEYFISEFKKSPTHGLVAWHNESMGLGHDGTAAAEDFEWNFNQQYDVKLQDYFDELNESVEPSDDELFGEMKYDHRKIGDVVALLGKYIIDNQGDEGISDEEVGDANVLLIAGNKFKTQGMLAGIQALEFMESLPAWEQLETDLAHTLDIDLNEMIDSYTSAG